MESLPPLPPPIWETENETSETAVETEKEGPEITPALEKVLPLVIEAGYPNLQYWFECEFEEGIQEKFWERIARKLEQGKVVEITNTYFRPKFPNKRRVYRIVKTSFNKQYLEWWNFEHKKFSDQESTRIL